jgi:hypothetical protein
MLKEALARRILIANLGLAGLKSLTFHLGFEGPAQRSTVVLNVREPKARTGLLRLFASPLELPPEELPALPPDPAYVRLQYVDWGTTYEVLTGLLKLVELGTALRDGRWPPGEAPDLDRLVGAEVRKDLLASLDAPTAITADWSEGPSFLGLAVAIKVKDTKKLEEGLRALTKAVEEAAGKDGRARFRKQTYRGAELYTLQGGRELPVPLTYTVHRGWLVLGVFPQAVKGYVLRSEGKHRTWKLPPLARDALTKGEKGTLVAVTVTDPRPAIRVGLAVLPTVLQIAGPFLGGPEPFDIGKVPNAHTVNEHLFPNVTTLHDDGGALRWESRFSVPAPGVWSVLPFVLGGLFDLPL